ncbi:receptor protein kinase TMK1-like [Rosa rugosa]|uniref:receptor protein kinase TMK1-like n=1 Tax=Rosa rugosa TaxID=74645 RepID=UPI002B416ED7|nr:receptor protein kinase TMK1-like [Rosa rugosa]XP_062015949.1 receptor protein kinase TMK1-like [Rosa rugosa]
MDRKWMVGNFLFLWLLAVVYGATDPADMKILNDFRIGLENPELLKWPENGDDPCGSKWPHVFCSGDRVTQIQVQGMGIKGPLPQNFNQLSKLYNLGLQKNNFNGKLPTFSGLSELQYAYLDNNDFDTIPSDFFNGLTSLSVMALDNIPLNASTGWSIPNELENSAQLQNLSLIECNLVGQLPEFLGTLPNLRMLQLSFNRLTGGLPKSFGQSLLQILWLNNQDGGGMTGPIDVIGSMTSLTQVWLHGNKFTGTIPENIGDLVSLKELNLNGNQLVGQIPQALADLKLDKLDLANNQLMGAIPKFQSGNISYSSNSFCQTDPGLLCAPQVTALLDFLGDLSYPSSLTSDWSGNDPCGGPWLGISCNPQSKVSVINLPRRKLNGTLSPSLVNLDSLIDIRLAGNNISGTVPTNLTELKSLTTLDISGNNIEPPLPKFRDNVRLITDGNPLLVANKTAPSPLPTRSPPPLQPPAPADNPPPGTTKPPQSPVSLSPPSPTHSNAGAPKSESQLKSSKKSKPVIVVAGVAVIAVFVILLLMCLSIYWCKYRKNNLEAPCSIVVHPKDPSDPANKLKIAVSSNTNGSLSTKTGTTYLSNNSSGTQSSYMTDSGNLVISVQVLRKVTNNFAPENELGHGGFGTVYKGELEDGTNLAVKRMEGGVISSKGLDEFQAEIAVLSKVRHRHLVSLLGYSVEGSERLLVYEYMSQGALSRHLFHWKTLSLKPLSWTRRLIIALDVARGVEYLHSLARQTFIHRDLKSSNILLGDDFRAKVSDFGLVKLAPDGEKSVATRLAGTFGYLAPEYAVMGKITTKVDVFSFGVVLMELVTGLMALDENRPEESRYLAEWFWRIKSSKEKLMAAVDPTIEVTEETFESISLIADLAGHCTAREPTHRPDMGHAVNVLGQLVEKWKPVDEESESLSGIDYNQPLPQMLKVWQQAESREVSYTSLEDSKGSIPARPAGFADSFTSTDGR